MFKLPPCPLMRDRGRTFTDLGNGEGIWERLAPGQKTTESCLAYTLTYINPGPLPPPGQFLSPRLLDPSRPQTPLPGTWLGFHWGPIPDTFLGLHGALEPCWATPVCPPPIPYGQGIDFPGQDIWAPVGRLGPWSTDRGRPQPFWLAIPTPGGPRTWGDAVCMYLTRCLEILVHTITHCSLL